MTTTLAPVRPRRKHNRNRNRARTASQRNPATITGPVYLASSLGTFRTPRYDANLTATRAHFRRADVLPARDLFHSNEDWRRRWPAILPTLRALVFFDDDAGYLGLGTWTELADAQARNLPTFYLSADGRFYPSASVAVHRVEPGDWTRYASVQPPPDPNTSDWFATQATITPHQALMTADVVAQAGRSDVCSICGDRPAPIYELTEPPLSTVRLCDDCLSLQRAMFGLKVRPLDGRSAGKAGTP